MTSLHVSKNIWSNLNCDDRDVADGNWQSDWYNTQLSPCARVLPAALSLPAEVDPDAEVRGQGHHEYCVIQGMKIHHAAIYWYLKKAKVICGISSIFYVYFRHTLFYISSLALVFLRQNQTSWCCLDQNDDASFERTELGKYSCTFIELCKLNVLQPVSVPASVLHQHQLKLVAGVCSIQLACRTTC